MVINVVIWVGEEIEKKEPLRALADLCSVKHSEGFKSIRVLALLEPRSGVYLHLAWPRYFLCGCGANSVR